VTYSLPSLHRRQSLQCRSSAFAVVVPRPACWRSGFITRMRHSVGRRTFVTLIPNLCNATPCSNSASCRAFTRGYPASLGRRRVRQLLSLSRAQAIVCFRTEQIKYPALQLMSGYAALAELTPRAFVLQPRGHSQIQIDALVPPERIEARRHVHGTDLWAARGIHGARL
jgi:hypothetical protein